MAKRQSPDTPSQAALERYERLEAEPTRVVAPDVGFVSGASKSLADIWHHHQLLGLLTRRELKARYKDSVLGYLWTLIRPMVSLAIYYFAIGKILGAERSIPDFAIYVFAGLTAWALFNNTIAAATGSVVANSGIVKKVYLPREIFPLSAAGASLVDFLSQLAILALGALVIRGIPWVNFILYAPLSILVMFVWANAFGLLLAALNVYLRDIQYLVEVGLQIGFWLTPSVYSFAMVMDAGNHTIGQIYLLNPTALGVLGFQAAFWKAGAGAVWPSHLFIRLVIALVVGLAFLFLFQRIFNRLQTNFAQEL